MSWRDFYNAVKKSGEEGKSYSVKNQLFYDVLTDAQGNETRKAYVAVKSRTYKFSTKPGTLVQSVGENGSFEQFIEIEGEQHLEQRCFVEVQIDKMKTIPFDQIESMKTDETILEVGIPVKVEITPGVFEYYVACSKDSEDRTFAQLLTSDAKVREDKYWTKLELAE